MTEAAALSAMGGAPTVNQFDGGHLLTADGGAVAVTTCRGVVTSAQETFGATLTDFASEAEDTTKSLGKPAYRTRTMRTRIGAGTSVIAYWPLQRGEWQVEVFQMAAGTPQVYRRITTGPQNCPAPTH